MTSVKPISVLIHSVIIAVLVEFGGDVIVIENHPPSYSLAFLTVFHLLYILLILFMFFYLHRTWWSWGTHLTYCYRNWLAAWKHWPNSLTNTNHWRLWVSRTFSKCVLLLLLSSINCMLCHCSDGSSDEASETLSAALSNYWKEKRRILYQATSILHKYYKNNLIKIMK